MDEMSTLADLLDLQSVDVDIDRLLDNRQNLPELDQYKAAHAVSAERASALAALQEKHRELSLAIDKSDGELDIAETKLNQQEQRLFAGGMSAKETDNMRMEVESLRRQKAEMEDSVLEMLDTRESLETDIAAAEQAAQAATQEESRLEGAISEAWKKIDAELARRENRKGEIVPAIDPELVELYTDLRNRRGGVVVGALVDKTCGACHMVLSASEHHEALQASPPRCIHCGAILVP